MKIELKQFQAEAVEQLIEYFDAARYEAGKGTLQAISLASPTGSGKTAIATAVIERILEGDEDHSPDPHAVFLWITDQPELNEQTRNKMLETSSVLGTARLVIIDASLNQETLTPGRVYFLNTQKLGRNSTLVRQGDGRNYTLWQTISNTVTAYPTTFYVIVDEAHRGMKAGREREEANSIIQKFILGSNQEIPAVPLLFAISATIERFDEVVARGRVKRPVEVSIEAVRASGLLKDAVNLWHPDEDQPADITMLREAARAWKTYRQRWAEYAETTTELRVEPVLLIQVQDGSGKQVSKTQLDEVLAALTDELGILPPEALAHAFQEGGPLTVGSTTIRYLAPSAIDADPQVQVVFFKTSLNTGWDCPRAEVMMSFRSASDDTLIAQLVGRMIRAPLARRIDTDEHLNTVALYLPHYDREGLKKVIRRLQADDPTTLPPTDFREGKEVQLLTRTKGSEAVFDLLSELPSYVIPRSKSTSQVRRLGKLASLLTRYGIETNAPDAATAFLTNILTEEYGARKNSAEFKEVVKESGVLRVRMVEWRYDPLLLPEKYAEIPISTENVNDLFDWAGRRLGEGLHKAYWKVRVAGGATSHLTTKLEAYALAASTEVVDRLEGDAQRRVQDVLKRYNTEIKKLAAGGRQAFNEVRELALEPESSNPIYPLTAELPRGNHIFDRHLLVDSHGKVSFTASLWEQATLAEELQRKDLVGWVRNPVRKGWSICIPYEMGKSFNGCYPDFLVVRREGRDLLVDIVDPHLLTYEDAWYRAKGMAKYAAKHADSFGRIEMIRVEEGRVERLDLIDEAQRSRVLNVSSNAHLRELFDNR